MGREKKSPEKEKLWTSYGLLVIVTLSYDHIS
jgi:hypothetical protein